MPAMPDLHTISSRDGAERAESAAWRPAAAARRPPPTGAARRGQCRYTGEMPGSSVVAMPTGSRVPARARSRVMSSPRTYPGRAATDGPAYG